MKSLLRLFLLSLVITVALDYLIPGLYITPTYQSYFMIAAVFMFLRVIAIPILAIIFLPINFLTGGFLKIFLMIGSTYLLVMYLPAIQLQNWNFPGYTFAIPNFPQLNLILPSIQFQLWQNIVLISLLYTILMSFFLWLFTDTA